jgi:hypothetical protein
MKFSWMLVMPFVLGLTFTTAFAADKEEKVEIKSKDSDGKEFKMKVHKKNNSYVGVSGEKEYILRGDAVTTVTTDGEYVVYGAPSEDGRYFETRRIKPAVVTRETRVVEEPVNVKVEERPVIREREVKVQDDDPIIKLPGIEIND